MRVWMRLGGDERVKTEVCVIKVSCGIGIAVSWECDN